MISDGIEIRTRSELRRLVRSRTINKDIVVRGRRISALNGVETIRGSLRLVNCLIESLGNLKEITGDFWLSSNTVDSELTSLGNLERIGGELWLRSSNISNLGNLKHVGGKVNLRDTKVSNLGILEYVGGDLYLPKRLENRIDLSATVVKGRVRYWKDRQTGQESTQKDEPDLIHYKHSVPYWRQVYVYSTNELSGATRKQLRFYKVYRKSFLDGEYLDLDGNDNYAFILFFDLLSDYRRHRDFPKLQSQFSELSKYYPITEGYTIRASIELLVGEKNFEAAWQLERTQASTTVQTILEYEHILQRSLIDGELIVKLGGLNHITQFGRRNFDSIKPYVTEQLRAYEHSKGMWFFELFISNLYQFKYTKKTPARKQQGLLKCMHGKESEKKFAPRYDPELYRQYYLSESEYSYFKGIGDKHPELWNAYSIPHVVEKAIMNQCRLILRQAEDTYRESIGLPKIGEGWISETELYHRIAASFPGHEVIHHGRPKWLGQQHLDIYMPDLGIGIEYQGPQHYTAIDFFGGEEALKKTRERDERKRRKCKDNNCALICVDGDYVFEDLENEIRKIAGK
jgi:hypothetical protein